MTEKQFIMHKEQAEWDQHKAIENLLRLGEQNPQRENTRNIYRSIKCDPHTPKDKIQLWRSLGKLLSINDFEFDLCDDNRVVVKSVSLIKVKGDEAKGLTSERG
jgi:hypothetical protein